MIQDVKRLNPTAPLGVAVREFSTNTGPVDYVLFVNGMPVGVIEAKKSDASENITTVEEQIRTLCKQHVKMGKSLIFYRLLTKQRTKDVWIYDFRTNIHFTLKQHPMSDADLEDFILCYNPENRYKRTETYSADNPDGRFRKFSADEIIERDKKSLDIFWIKDKH